MSITRKFAEHLDGLFHKGLDPSAERVALDLVLDGISVGLLGSQETGPSIYARLAAEVGATPVATLIGHARRVAGSDAARANGAAMHVLDFEPMWNPANHSLSTVLPAVIATVEMILRKHPSVGSRAPAPTGKTLLLALAIGIEAQARLRIASSQYDPGKLLFHPPGTVGPIGSAIACGLLLGLDVATLTHAAGIAVSRAGGVQQNIGSMTKALHCGQAAASGLESALLAAHGFTADADAIGGPRGHGRAFFADGFMPEQLTETRPVLHIVEPGPAFKFYPSQYGTHFVITAALEARRKLPAGATIKRVKIVSPPMPYCDRPEPLTGLAGKFSFQYTAATALLDGAVGVQSFTDERRFRADMAALLPLIAIENDDSREGRFDRLHVDVHVETAAGDTCHGACSGPPGIWGRPAERTMLTDKARDCMAAVVGAERAERLVAETHQFPAFDGERLLAFFGEFQSNA